LMGLAILTRFFQCDALWARTSSSSTNAVTQITQNNLLVGLASVRVFGGLKFNRSSFRRGRRNQVGAATAPGTRSYFAAEEATSF
jgi:hypothetical protein